MRTDYGDGFLSPRPGEILTEHERDCDCESCADARDEESAEDER